MKDIYHYLLSFIIALPLLQFPYSHAMLEGMLDLENDCRAILCTQDSVGPYQTARSFTLCNQSYEPLLAIKCIIPKPNNTPDENQQPRAMPIIISPLFQKSWDQWEEKTRSISFAFRGILLNLKQQNFETVSLSQRVHHRFMNEGVSETLLEKIAEDETMVLLSTNF